MKPIERGIKEGLVKWEKSVIIERDIKALVQIKVMLDDLILKGYHIDYELEEYLDEIEAIILEAKKKDYSNQHLNNIQILISKHYEELGRKGESNGNEASILFSKLNAYFDKVELPSNYIAIEKLKFERKEI